MENDEKGPQVNKDDGGHAQAVGGPPEKITTTQQGRGYPGYIEASPQTKMHK